MSPITAILFLICLHQYTVFGLPKSAEFELLKFKIEHLERKVMEETRQMKIKEKVDIRQIRLQEEEDVKQLRNDHEADISSLKTRVQQQNHSLQEVKKQSHTLSTYCKLLPAETCGPCVCLDDYQRDMKYVCDCQDVTPKRDCKEHYEGGQRTSGLYLITMKTENPIQAYCDQETDGGGWTVIQRRMNGKVDFYRNWSSYKIGFGNPMREYWLGNEKIYVLAVISAYPDTTELRIDMQDWISNKLYAKYSSFSVDNEKDNYMLHVAGHSGNCGDSLSYSNNMQFATHDKTHGSSCPKSDHGGWWYNNCAYANLNGQYLWLDYYKHVSTERNVVWHKTLPETLSMKFVEMKVRRRS